MNLLYQIWIGIFVVGLCFYLYVDRQNDLIKLQIELPLLRKELRLLEEENRQLLFAIEESESPLRIMQLRKDPKFSHLKDPHEDTIIILEESH